MIKDSKELKVGDIFYNTNKHLSIVYATKLHKASILNYNGSIYTVSRDTQREYEVISTISIIKFFKEYPKDKIYPEMSVDFYDIKKLLLSLNIGESDSLELYENKLLLIL